MIRLSTMYYFFKLQKTIFFPCCWLVRCVVRVVVLARVVGAPGRGCFWCELSNCVFVISHHSHSSMSEPPENKRMARAVLWKLPLARSTTKRRRSDCGTCTGLMHVALRGSVARRVGLRCCQKLGLVLICSTVEHTQYKYLAPERL